MSAIFPFVTLKEIRADGTQHFVDQQNDEHFWFRGVERAEGARPNDQGFLTRRYDRGLEYWVFKRQN